MSISASFAADVNQTNNVQTSNDDTVVSSSDENVYSAGSDSEKLSATSGSFKDLSTLINSSTTGSITLDKNYTYNSDTDSAFVNGITINKTISIDGAGYTINGNNQARIFWITETANNVLIRDVIFINGNDNGAHSAAIKWYGDNGYLVASTFKNNVATGNTGAISWYGAYGTITGCTFKENSAKESGAIYTSGTEIKISSCIFDSNHATLNRGVGLIEGTYSIVEDCTFINNYADNTIGALSWSKTQGKLISSNFTNNHAKSNGAVFFAGTYGTIENCLFDNNYATGDFGALRTYNEGIMIINSIFKNNNATNNGGALYSESSQSSVIGCYFENNHVTTSGAGGGAIYQRQNLIIQSSTFVKNSACWGGAIYGGDNYLTLETTTFKQNTALNRGGAINIQGGIIVNCTFEENDAVEGGGAIRSRVAAPYIVNNAFTRNTGADGGAIDCAIAQAYLNNNTFMYNEATNNGGAINVAAASIYVGNAKFIGNSANNLGGGVYVTGNYFGLDNSTFTSNTAKSNSGAIYIKEGLSVSLDYSLKTSSDTVNASNIINMPKKIYIESGGTGTGATEGDATNWADAFSRIATGGTIYFKAGTYTDIRGVTINKNVKLIGIGDVTIDLDTKNRAFRITAPCCSIDNIDFKNGFINDVGGAIYVINAWFTYISNCNFENNYGTTGGAIDMYGRHGTVINCTFKKNRARDNGGAYFSGAFIQSIINCTFIENTAKYGGGVYTSSTNSELIDCKFIKNNATTNGGGLYWALRNGIISDCTFNENSAVKGGAIYWANQDGTVINCNFTNNTATDGGALYSTGIRMSVEGSDFTNNSATGNGGALYSTGRETSVSDSDFNGNNATTGGAISSNGVKGSVTNSSFENNAAENGSAIILGDGLDISISNTEFTNNEGNGSVYIPEGSSFKVINNTFENNTGGDIETPGVVSAEILFASVNGTDTGLTDKTPTTWKQALENVIEGGIIYLLPGTYSMTDLVTLEKSVSIIGYGNGVIINSYSRGQLFSIKANNVKLENIEFKGISGDYIVWDGTNGEIESCNFDGSNANSNSKLISTSVSSNVFKVSKSNFTGFKYNIIYTTNYGTIIEDCIFKSNEQYSTNSYLIDIVGSDSRISNSKFESNNGKLINFESAANRGLISGSTFTSNAAGSGNSMIYINSKDSTISGSTFKSSNTGGTFKNVYATEDITLTGNTIEGVTASLNTITAVTYPNNPTLTGTFNDGINRAYTIPVTANNVLLPNVKRSGTTASFTYSDWDKPLPNTYSLNFATTDANGNKYTYTSTPSSKTATVNRLDTVYISPSGTGTGASSTSQTTWDKVADIITDTGEIVFTGGIYTNFYGKTIDKSWTLSSSGTVTLDANNQGRHFTINANNVKISGMTLKNGKVTTGKGGSIYNTGNGLTIDNVTFTGNTAPFANIIGSNQVVTVTNSVLDKAFNLTTNNINYGTGATVSGSFINTKPTSVTLKLSNGVTATVNVNNLQFSNTFNNLPVGTYTVTMTDSNANSYTFDESAKFTVSRISKVYISPSGTGTGATSTSPTTWDKVADIITDDGEITFEAGTYPNFNSKTISKSWTLTADGAVILDALNNGRIFTVSGNNVKINGKFTFKNAKADNDNGGAIYWTGTGGSITGATFTSNSAKDYRNIYATNGLTLKENTFDTKVTITTSGNIYYNQTETISGTFDAGTNIWTSIGLKLNNQQTQITNTNNIYSYTTTASTLANNTYVVTLNNKDSNNNNYVFTQPSASFVVSKYQPTLTVTYNNNIYYGNTIAFTVDTGYSDATGEITITVGNTLHKGTLNGGKATITFNEDWKAGVYDAEIVYTGDNKYHGSVVTKQFNVVKYATNVVVTIADKDNIHVDDNLDITVQVNHGTEVTNVPTGNVTIQIGDVIKTVNLDNTGKAHITWDSKILKAGEYIVQARYNGDDRYKLSEVGTASTVAKQYATTLTVTITQSNIKVDQDISINLKVTSETGGGIPNGNITVLLEGRNETVLLNANGEATFTRKMTNASTYKPTFTYQGSDKYSKSADAAHEFTVSKYTPTVTITTDKQSYKVDDNVVISVSVSGEDGTPTGSVNIIFNGQTTKVDLDNNGRATLTVKVTEARMYEITADYLKDYKYTEKTEKISITPTVYSISDLSVSVDSVMVGEDVEITATVSADYGNLSGDVAFDVAGQVQIITLDNGVAKATFKSLAAHQGSEHYSVAVTYNGNYKYDTRTTTASFQVFKYASTITINVDDNIEVDDEVEFTINVNAIGNSIVPTGNVTVSQNGVTSQPLTLVNGAVTYNYKVNAERDWSFTVNYYGDNNYNMSTNSVQFHVTKHKTTLTITIDKNDIKVDDEITFTASVESDDLTGIEGTTVTIGSSSDAVTITLGADGKGTGKFKVQTDKEYTLGAIYHGNYKFNTSSYNIKRIINI